MAFRRTVTLSLTRALGEALLGALSARPAAALLVTPNVHLFTAGPVLNPDMVLGDFTESAFGGYATDALGAVIGPVRLSNDIEGVHAEVDFLATSPVGASENILGYFITDTTNAILYAAEIFDVPVPIINPGDFLSVDVIFPQALVLETA